MMISGVDAAQAMAGIAGRQQPAELSPLGLKARASRMTNEQIDKTAKDFESMFLSQMLEQMFGESVGSELFGDEQTSEIYKGLVVEQYGKEIARSGGIGIADYVRKELLRLQEV
ncbi:MAG: rod-binding protein [Alphaproteobacteria bacterium]|nr:rod-binding protein [Alphaproteobacteria bacterium]